MTTVGFVFNFQFSVYKPKMYFRPASGVNANKLIDITQIDS